MIRAFFGFLRGHLVRPAGHLEQVISELCLHRALDGIHIGTEYNFVKFFDHHSGTKLTEITALLS